MTWYGTLSLVCLNEGTIDNFYQLISGKNANKKQNHSQHQVSRHDLLPLLRRKTQQCWYYPPTSYRYIHTHRYIYIYKNTKTIIYLWSGLFLLIFSSIAYLEIQRSFSQRAVANPMLLIIYILLYPICIPINVQN